MGAEQRIFSGSRTLPPVLFTSWPFAAFVVVVATVFYLPGLRRWQLAWLVAASLALYAWMAGAMFWLLIVCGALTTVCSRRVRQAVTERERRTWAVAGVLGNVLVLSSFKYGRLATGALPAGSPLTVLLLMPIPAGISFYTFHGISLIVDVWRGRWETPADRSRHVRDVSLYLSFFPQLVAGPIVRAREFLPQIGPKFASDIRWPVVARAVITGVFLKLVVADHLAFLTVDLDAQWMTTLPGLNLLGLIFGYAMQLFADFAAYSSLAIGLAALFGFVLPRNFAFPYLSESVGEFWRRWHISLGAWLRDYVYIPLGGNRGSAERKAFTLLLTMTLAGLWHGAVWGYAVWGLWTGLGMWLERALGLDPSRSRSLGVRCLRVLGVFTFFCVGLLFFRLRDIGAAMLMWRAIAVQLSWSPNLFLLASIGWFSLPVIAYHGWGRLQELRPDLADRLVAPLLGVLLAWTIIDAAAPVPFIYFQF